MKRLIALTSVALLVAVGFVLAGSGVVSAAPPAPTPIAPADGSTVSGTSVTFEWGAVTGAVNYRLVVSKSTAILNQAAQKTVADVGDVTSYIDTAYVSNGTKYYWWVFAYGADGSHSEWSDVSTNMRWFRTPTIATVTMTAPSAISFGTFRMGWNVARSTTPGKVTVVAGTSGLTTWTVTAQASSPYMGNDSDTLTNPLLIGPDGSLEPWTDWHIANGGTGSVDGHSFDGPLVYSGTSTPGYMPFYAAQFIESGDLRQGTYTSVITFAATCLP